MLLPKPSVNFDKLVRQTQADADRVSQTYCYNKIGNITSSITGAPIGVVVESGTITDFVVGLSNRGRDDVHDLSLSVDLKKNGVSIISGELSIDDSVSGEAGTYAVTASAPTFTSTAVVRGDLLSLDATLTRTASPTTEMSDLFTSVKIIPVIT